MIEDTRFEGNVVSFVARLLGGMAFNVCDMVKYFAYVITSSVNTGMYFIFYEVKRNPLLARSNSGNI